MKNVSKTLPYRFPFFLILSDWNHLAEDLVMRTSLGWSHDPPMRQNLALEYAGPSSFVISNIRIIRQTAEAECNAMYFSV
jgi:hypothetical protein